MPQINVGGAINQGPAGSAVSNSGPSVVIPPGGIDLVPRPVPPSSGSMSTINLMPTTPPITSTNAHDDVIS